LWLVEYSHLDDQLYIDKGMFIYSFLKKENVIYKIF